MLTKVRMWTTSLMQMKQYYFKCYCRNIAASLFIVFKYLAEKYLQRLKQQTADETEVVHTTSNKIGKQSFCTSLFMLHFLLCRLTLLSYCVFPKVFLIPQVVLSATRVPAMAEKSSLCDLTNNGPRRVKILLEAATYSR